MFRGHCGSIVKDTFNFCVKSGNLTSNNTETAADREETSPHEEAVATGIR